MRWKVVGNVQYVFAKIHPPDQEKASLGLVLSKNISRELSIGNFRKSRLSTIIKASLKLTESPLQKFIFAQGVLKDM